MSRSAVRSPKTGPPPELMTAALEVDIMCKIPFY